MRRSYAAVLSLLGATNLLPALAHADPSFVIDWSGAYLGASLGAAEGKGKTSTQASVGGVNDYFTTTDPQQLGAAGGGNVSHWDGSGGVFVGYGRQRGNLYWGAEGSLNSLSFSESRNPATQTYLSSPTSAFTIKQTVEADWQGTLRARLGMPHGRWLPYLTGGIAVTRLKLESDYSDTLGLRGRGHGTSEETQPGWVVGAGAEYALSERLSLRVEYLYADYGSVDTSFAITNPAYAGLSSTLKDTVDFRTQTVTLGLAYRF